MSTFVDGTEYVVINCGHSGNGCGISFAVTREFYDHVKGIGACWHCPNGHSRIFTGPSEKQQLREAKVRETALQDQLSAAIRDAEQTRVALLRDRARFAAGVCPCCNRSFENVRRHMLGQHPEYDVSRVSRAVPKAFKCSCGGRFDTLRGLRTHQGHQRRSEGNYRWDAPAQSRWWSHLTEVGAR